MLHEPVDYTILFRGVCIGKADFLGVPVQMLMDHVDIPGALVFALESIEGIETICDRHEQLLSLVRLQSAVIGRLLPSQVLDLCFERFDLSF